MKTATSPSNLCLLFGSSFVGCMTLGVMALFNGAMASGQTAPVASHPATPVAVAKRQAAAKPVHRSEEEQSEAKPDDAGHQGIKVHGHWKIDIKNPDGSLASTHEFENSLSLLGPFLLADLLTGQIVPGGAGIQLLSYSQTPCGPLYGTDPCSIFSGTSGQSAGVCKPVGQYDCSTNLVAHIVSSSVNFSGLVLSGSVVATQNGDIEQVVTEFVTCSLTGEPRPLPIGPGNGYTGASPQACSSASASNLAYGPYPNVPLSLTGTGISFINVLSGQTIQVSVTLTFS